ncbi:CFEM domain-containing protein [Blastomyces dermatitidis ATCC 18188]|uniref:CFEM domain-containing protein n=1 Tax=Ajellomyces dermatitidis (strain ATCC 18188 / CBS 674.68) TaxID=653446 RepID=F2T3R3_AJEDA|nr:CFEM domain-containing protein [Blastomyces dermatitidis ATCC 18188]
MKVSVLLSAGAFAALGAAQDWSGVSDCARGCIERMLGLAPSLGCKTEDVPCLCTNMDFAYGVRDCTIQACGPEDLPGAAAAATEFCPDDPPGASPSGSQDATETPTGEHTPSPTRSSSPTDSTATRSESPASTPYTTQPIVSTITSGTQVITTTVGSTTLYSPVSDATGTPRPTGTESEPTGSSTASPTDQPNTTGTNTGTGATPEPTDNGAFHILAPATQGIMGALGVVALLAL